MKEEIRKHLIQPVCFYLGQSKPYWAGTEEESGHWEAWEMLFGSMSVEQLKFLAKYYMETVYPQIRKEIQRSKRVYFPSPADMQSYMEELKDKKKERENKRFRERQEEERVKQDDLQRQKEEEELILRQQAYDKALEFLKSKDEKKIQYAARCFRFESLNLPKEGPYWDITKGQDAVILLTEIIKSGKLEEFKETL